MRQNKDVNSVFKQGLTCSVAPWWMVEGQAEGDDGGDLQDDEGDVLQRLPDQLQERLGLLGGN